MSHNCQRSRATAGLGLMKPISDLQSERYEQAKQIITNTKPIFHVKPNQLFVACLQ
jgi:hypothetical protein